MVLPTSQQSTWQNLEYRVICHFNTDTNTFCDEAKVTYQDSIFHLFYGAANLHSKGDLLIANSGSGEVVSVYNVAYLAKEAGASVITVTANPEGRIAKISEVVVHLPAEVWGPGKDTVPSIQPMGCLFEQSLLILRNLMVLI